MTEFAYANSETKGGCYERKMEGTGKNAMAEN